MNWSEESRNISYNSWLREEALNSKSTLNQNMAKLRQALLVLESVISQEGTTSVRFVRISTAINHLISEIHLLVISTEDV